MPSFRTRRRVAFSPQQMYALVADVGRYPEFVPLCESLTVEERQARGEGEVLTAIMGVGYKAIRETFRCHVILDPRTPMVEVQGLPGGAFLNLTNCWQFPAINDGAGTDVDFFISYELKSPIFQILAGAVLEQAYRRFAEAFEARAQQVYGRLRK